MKLINPSVELITQTSGLEGIYKQVERVGRVCYKSEDKITEDSAKPFVDRMIKSGHGAMLEHGTIYLFIPWNEYYDKKTIKYLYNKYSANNGVKGVGVYITTNLRVLVENGWLDDLKYICEPTEYHERRITVHFVCDRGVSHEFVKHRVMSFAQESTRYCNYSKDKFGGEVTFVLPNWMPSPIWDENNGAGHIFLQTMKILEDVYLELLSVGWTPQQARAVLPNSLKTELVVTGFTSDWNHFFDLRYRGTTGAPHPDAKQVASMAHDLIFKELGEDL